MTVKCNSQKECPQIVTIGFTKIPWHMLQLKLVSISESSIALIWFHPFLTSTLVWTLGSQAKQSHFTVSIVNALQRIIMLLFCAILNSFQETFIVHCYGKLQQKFPKDIVGKFVLYTIWGLNHLRTNLRKYWRNLQSYR